MTKTEAGGLGGAHLEEHQFCLLELPPKAKHICQVVAGSAHVRVILPEACFGLLKGTCCVRVSVLVLPLHALFWSAGLH